MAMCYDPARLADVTEAPVDVGAKEYRLIVVGEDTPVLAVTTNLVAAGARQVQPALCCGGPTIR